MKGGQQAVAVGKFDQHFLAGIGNRRVMAQVMPDCLQIAADPGKPLATERRQDAAGIIAKKPHPGRRQ